MQSILHRTPRTLAHVLLALASVAVLSTQTALAQSPPNPPARFAGSVVVNGQPAAPGTTVEAHIGAATCGTGTVFMSGAEARFVLDSPDKATAPGCGTDGAVVSFVVGGRAADQTGIWHSYQLNTVSLSVGGSTTPTAQPARTPVAPSTGSGLATTTSSNEALVSAVGMFFALAGVAAAWRFRALRHQSP